MLLHSRAWGRYAHGRGATIGLLIAVGLAAGAGCLGRIGDPSSGSSPPGSAASAQCASAAPDTEPVIIRMLNVREYGNTLRDLLGVTLDVANALPADPIVDFDNHAESLVASSLLVEAQLDLAEQAAAAVDIATLLPCADADSCIDAFITTFGRRAFRRPVAADEAAELRAIYDDAKAAGRDAAQAVRLVIEGFLLSPQFLYRAETTVTPGGGVVSVDPYELASRLSYFLWASMPDDELLDAAESGALSTLEQIEAQARRLLADPKARDVTKAFHALWLQLYKLSGTTKEATLYPDYDTVRPLFGEETARFAEYVFWDADAGAREYLLSTTGFMNTTLASHYGLSVTPGEAFAKVDLEGTERFGILSQGSFLSIFSNPDRTSPTRRGKFVRSQLLCQPPPPPPANVPPLDPPSGTATTMRERLAQHENDPACKGCHQLLDPVGFGLENYDTVGRYRTEDGGQPVDASGELLGVTKDAGAFVGGRELAEHLVATDEYYACVATQWFRFAVGRDEGMRDACTVQGIVSDFRASGERLTDLLIAIARSNAMVLKNTEKAP